MLSVVAVCPQLEELPGSTFVTSGPSVIGPLPHNTAVNEELQRLHVIRTVDARVPAVEQKPRHAG